jgi:hypothetical protein
MGTGLRPGPVRHATRSCRKGYRTLVEGLAWRPRLYARNDVVWVSTRAWRARYRPQALEALKLAKRAPDDAVIAAAGLEMAGLAARLLGCFCGWTVTSVPCGHSCRCDCFGKRLARSVAEALDVPFLQLWEDRFTPGVSHPKASAKLAPLRFIAKPDGPVLLVDDVATSGWHIEEGLRTLRSNGVAAAGLVWISGIVQ